MSRTGDGITKLGGGRAVRYKARWKIADGSKYGSTRSKTFTTRAEAVAHLARVRADQSRGTYVDPTAGRVKVADYLAAWQEEQRHWRPATTAQVTSYFRSRVLPHLGHLDLGAVRSSHLRTWVATLVAADLAPGTIETMYRHLSAAFAAAVDDGLIPSSPCRTAAGRSTVKLPKADEGKLRREQVPTVAQVLAITEALPDRYAALAVVAAGTGLRQGEALGLTLDRVDFLGRTVRVDRQMVTPAKGTPHLAQPKTASSVRTVPLPSHVAEALAEHLRAYPVAEDGLIFTRDDGEPIRRSHLGVVWRRAADSVEDLPTGVGFHALRHHYASLQIDAGLSVVAVQHLLGHKDATTTLDTYGHWWPESDDRARQAVEAAYQHDWVRLGPDQAAKGT